MSDDSKIHDLEIQIVTLREQLSASHQARDLQAKEYERRLQELNHAHQQQMDRNAQYVSRETWELHNAAVDVWRREIDKWRWTSYAGVAGGGMGMIAILARFLKL